MTQKKRSGMEKCFSSHRCAFYVSLCVFTPSPYAKSSVALSQAATASASLSRARSSRTNALMRRTSLCTFFVKGAKSSTPHKSTACDKACAKMNGLLGKYRIQDGALAVYDFFWTQICDWYVEYAKDAPNKAAAFAILRDVFWKALRLLHPYMPFVTEEVAQAWVTGKLPRISCLMEYLGW